MDKLKTDIGLVQDIRGLDQLRQLSNKDDASQQQAVDAALGPFDYGYASALWTLAFSTVVGLYFVSHGISLVLNMIRRG